MVVTEVRQDDERSKRLLLLSSYLNNIGDKEGKSGRSMANKAVEVEVDFSATTVGETG